LIRSILTDFEKRSDPTDDNIDETSN
jgi:hypothetical protein